MRRMPVYETPRGLSRSGVLIVPYKCNVPKQDLLLKRSLNDQNGGKAIDEVGGIVENVIALLHPAVGIERLGPHTEDPSRKDPVTRQKVQQRHRIEQARIARRIEERTHVDECGDEL